jgi:hypothetical protein
MSEGTTVAGAPEKVGKARADVKQRDVSQYEVHRHLHTYEKLMKAFDLYVKTLSPKKLAQIATICDRATRIAECVTPQQLANCTHNCAKAGRRETLVADIRRVDEAASILMQAYIDARDRWIKDFVEHDWRWDIVSPFLFKVCLTCGGPTGTDDVSEFGIPVPGLRNDECPACETKREQREEDAVSL